MTQKLRYFCTLLLMAVVGVAWAGDVTDVLTPDVIGISGSSYTTWSGVTATSDAVYAGQSSAGTGIQLRSNSNNSGVVTTTSGGKVKSITVEWHNSTQNGRTLNVYGKNSAYTQATDLYGNNAGTLLGTIVCGTSTSLTIDGDYEYIGLRSAGSAMYLNSITIVWDDGASSDAPSISAENVNIAYDATGGEIEYTIENPVTGTSLEANTAADWVSNINVGASSITFSTTENEGNAARVATFILTYEGAANKNVTVTQAGNPNAPGTENNPYTVAEARAAIDANTGVTGVYAKGIVSGIVTAFDSQYGNISYNISTDGTTTADQLQAYRGKSYGGANFTSANDIQVGDEVVIYGNLKKYNDTYEFDANNQLVSLNRPVYIEVSSYGEELLAGASGSTTVTVTYKGIDPETFDIAWFDQTGADAQESDWLLAEIKSTDDPEVYELTYVFDENTSTEARAAYFKVVALDNDAQLVESPLITVTQAGFVQEYDVFFVLENDETFVPNSDFETVLETVPAGTYTLPSAKKEGKVLTGWNDGTTTTAPGATYQVESDVYFYPVWKDKGVEEWVLTSIDELEEGDVFVIVGNNGSDYAMTNDNGASAPLPVAVTVEDEKITSEVADNMMWNIGGNATDGYSFFVNGSTENWLYCSTTAATGSNNNMKVGTGDRKTFILDGDGYLVTKDNNVARYLSIYVNSGTPQDWRGYINTNSAVAIAFYKKVETYPASTVKLTIRENFTATTFSSDKALDFSAVEGITAFIITDEKGATSEVTTVRANTGLYIEGAAGDYEIPIIANADEISGNLLEATDGTTEFKSDESTTYYVFGKQNGKEAFYKVPTSGYTPSANKAVLVVNAPESSAKEMIVIGGDVTGIESIENGTIVNDNYFTIDGKLVKGQPTQKGIYVVNGRKVVIK